MATSGNRVGSLFLYRTLKPICAIRNAIVPVAAGFLAFACEVAFADGPASVDSTFMAGSGAGGGEIRSLAYIPPQEGLGARILIGGTFTTYDGEERPRIALLTANGILMDEEDYDPAAPSGTFSPRVEAVAMDIDGEGRVIMGGWFNQVDGVERNSVARLNVNGGLDGSFNPGGGPNDIIMDMAVRNDGGVFAVGHFTFFDGSPAGHIASLNSIGQASTGFGGDGFDGVARTVIFDNQGRLLVGGSFSMFRGQTAGGLARLNSSGGNDADFGLGGQGFNGDVLAIAVTDDNHIFVGGDFTELNGNPANRLVKLTNTGSRVDIAGFDIGTGFNGAIHAIAVQPDGKVLVGGDFTEVNRPEGDPDEVDPNEFSYSRLVRLESSGEIDRSFDPGEGAEGTIRSIALQNDGKILLAGSIFTYNGEPHGGIVRLMGGDIGDNGGPTDPIGYELWASQQFTDNEFNNPAISAPDRDPDADGVPNVLEYAFNGDPMTPGTSAMPEIGIREEVTGEHLAITFLRMNAEDLVYRVEASNDLFEWEMIWSSEESPFGGTGSAVTEEVIDLAHNVGASGSGRRFMRVHVSLD